MRDESGTTASTLPDLGLKFGWCEAPGNTYNLDTLERVRDLLRNMYLRLDDGHGNSVPDDEAAGIRIAWQAIEVVLDREESR
jgi:hypothetical protein